MGISLIKNDNERTQNLKRNAIMMYLYRVAGIIVSFLYVPLLIDSLSVENYGIWLTLTSVVSWMSFFDVGLGNGMRNRVTSSLAKNDIGLAKEYVSTTYFIMSCIAILLVLFSVIIIPLFNWSSLLNAPNSDPRELTQLVLCVCTLFFVQLVLNLMSSLLNALQEPAKSASVNLYSQGLGLVVVFILNRIFNSDSLLLYGIIISTLPCLVMLFFSIIVFNGSLKKISPSIKCVNIRKSKDVFNVGAQFFLVQLTAIFMFHSNSFIIAQCVDVSSVVDYNLSYRYLSIPLMGYTILTAPLWSATTDAYARSDTKWIKETIGRMKKIGYAFSVMLVLLLIFSPLVYQIWLGNSISVRWSLMILLAIYVFLSLRTALFCSIINGIGKIRLQFYVTFTESIVHIPVSILLARHIGIDGVVVSLCALTLANAIWEPIQINKLLKNTAQGIWNK